MPVIIVKHIKPKISSINAAAKIVLPDLVDMQPSSFKVSTVIDTDVAVKTAPTKIAEVIATPGSNKYIKPAPIPSGTNTPVKATTKPALPDARKS